LSKEKKPNTAISDMSKKRQAEDVPNKKQSKILKKEPLEEDEEDDNNISMEFDKECKGVIVINIIIIFCLNCNVMSVGLLSPVIIYKI
jgi:hypothetical protein